MELNDTGIHSETKVKQEAGEASQAQSDDRLTEEENNKIGLVIALVEKQDHSSKEADDYDIRRFLRARDLDVEKASAMLLKYLKWRRSFVQNGSISVSDIPNEVAQNKVFTQGVDKQGRPIAVAFGGRHIQNTIGGLNEFKRFVVLTLDKLCARTLPGKEEFVVILDLQGFGYANSDVRGNLAALSILQELIKWKKYSIILKAVAMELNDDVIHSETKVKKEGEERLSEEEKNKIGLVRALVEKQDPSSKEEDDYAIRRFLRARDLDVDRASVMFLEYLKWRRSFVPNGSISVNDIPNELEQNKMFMQGVDKQGRPIAVAFGGRHIQNTIGGLDEFKRT